MTPTGTHQIDHGYFMNGRGDVTYGGTKILLAGQLGPLGPGLHRQSDIPGMPVGRFISKMNSSGVFVLAGPERGSEIGILTGGKFAPLKSLLPASVPVPLGFVSQLNVGAINEAGMIRFDAYNSVNGQLVGIGTFLLTPTLDCDVTLSGSQPYRLDDEFDIDVSVRNVAGSTVTEVRVEGDTPGTSGLSVSSWPAFDTLSGPTPAGPVTLAAGATQVFRYHVKAKRSGIGEVTAKVKGNSSRGTALRAQAAAPIEIEQRGDLLLKLAEEPAASFALNDIYQRGAPSGAQDRKVEIVSAITLAIERVAITRHRTRTDFGSRNRRVRATC